MTDKVRVYPSLEINLFADPESFVRSWDRIFPYGDEHDLYLKFRFTENLAERELLYLFEWFEKGSLKGRKLQLYQEQVASKLSLINLATEVQEMPFMMEAFDDLEPAWLLYLNHITCRMPYVDCNIMRAFHYINTSEIIDEPALDFESITDICAQLSDFEQKIDGLTPMYGIDAWNNALWAFGKFLKEHNRLFFM